VHRQPAIVDRVPGQAIHPKRDPVVCAPISRATGLRDDFYLATNVALHQANYATISNYLELELRYMDAGERGPKAPKLGHKGTPGYQ
jgi:hypothetical protein